MEIVKNLQVNPAYRNQPTREYVRECDIETADFIDEQVENSVESNLVNLIFAPDERTHLPQSDLSVYMSPTTSVEVRQFIEQHLAVDLGSSGGTSSADVALEMTEKRVNQLGTERAAYLQRIAEIAQAGMNRSNDGGTSNE